MDKHDERNRGKGKGRNRQRTPSPPNRRQPSPKPEVTNMTGPSFSGGDNRPPCHSNKRRRCLKDKNCDCWHPAFCLLHKRGQCRAGVTCSFVHLSKGDRQPQSEGSTTRGQSNKSASAKQTKVGRSSLQESKMDEEIIHAKQNSQVRSRHESRPFPPKKSDWHEIWPTSLDQVPRRTGTTQSVETSQRAPQYQRCVHKRAQYELLQKQLSTERRSKNSVAR